MNFKQSSKHDKTVVSLKNTQTKMLRSLKKMYYTFTLPKFDV